MAKTRTILPDAIAGWVHCLEPDDFQGAKTFKIDLIYSREEASRILEGVWLETARKEWPGANLDDLFRGQFKKLRRRSIERNEDGTPKRGDDDKVIPIVDKFGKSVMEEDKDGRVFITAKSKFAPAMFDAKGTEQTNLEVFPGDTVAAQVCFQTNPGGHTTENKPTVAIKLEGVQLIRQSGRNSGSARLLEGRDRSADAAERVASSEHDSQMGHQGDADDEPPF